MVTCRHGQVDVDDDDDDDVQNVFEIRIWILMISFLLRIRIFVTFAFFL